MRRKKKKDEDEDEEEEEESNTYIPAEIKPTLANEVIRTNPRLIFHCIFTSRCWAPLHLLNDTLPYEASVQKLI